MDENANTLKKYNDVRLIQQHLKSEVDEKTLGSGNIVVIDPDSNTILINQQI